MDHDARRRDDLAVGRKVVGDVEQAAEEGLVGADPLGADGVRGPALGQLLGIEPALGADRHDHRVLHLLGFHQAEHLGAEVVAPVGPAQATARHRAKAQVDALDIDSPDKDLAVRLGGRQVGEFARGHLERDVGLGTAIRAGLVEVGPLGRADKQRQAPQHAVLVQAFDQLQGLDDPGHHRVGLLAALRQIGLDRRVELSAEEVEDQPRHAGVGRQRLLLHALARIEPGLLAVAGQRADQGGVPPGDRQLHHQAVEAVVLGATGPNGDHGVLEGALQLGEHQLGAARILDLEVVDPDRGQARPRNREAGFGERLQPHVVEDRQDVRQRRRGLRAIELEPELQRAVGLGAIGPHADRLSRRHALDHRQIGQRLVGVEAVAIAGRERLAIAGQRRGDLFRRPDRAADRGVEAVFPGARRLGDLGLERPQVRLVMVSAGEADDVMDASQRRVGEARIGGRDPAAIGPRQDLTRPGREV